MRLEARLEKHSPPSIHSHHTVPVISKSNLIKIIGHYSNNEDLLAISLYPPERGTINQCTF